MLGKSVFRGDVIDDVMLLSVNSVFSKVVHDDVVITSGNRF